ncbi:MAG: hypothetical protein J6A30_05670 [Ruminococcus sp.]|nr:hypothetical protein [Ruminococcus sp.]
MNYMKIPEAICEIKNDTLLLLKGLRAAEVTDIGTHPDIYTEFITDASMRAEKIACEIRRIIYRSTDTRKAELLSGIAHGPHNIVIDEKGSVITITLPALLAKKKNANAEFLCDPLFCALSEYAIEHNIRKAERALICFEHIYDKALPIKQYRDYDNMEQKQILDVIALFLLCDDNSGLCDIYNTASAGE